MIEGGDNILAVHGKAKTSEPHSFALFQNYPNPFNPSTRISYQLPENSFVTVKVFDALGRELETLVHEQQSAGYHSVQFNAAQLPSGMYFYSLKQGRTTIPKNFYSSSSEGSDSSIENEYSKVLNGRK